MGMTFNGRKCKERDSCAAACINTLMDRDDCPHFFDGDGSDAVSAWNALRQWMRSKGKDLVFFPYVNDPRPRMQELNPDAHYMLIYDTDNDTHAAIFKGSERVFDPAWISAPIKGAIGGTHWLVGVIVDYIP